MVDFLQNLYQWYRFEKRDLPWRSTSDPYKIWISEIILQQTRIKQGINYYNHFIELFPTVSDLALASEDEVLKAWQGLGYYSRARNLHFTSKIIVKKFNGVFPEKYEDILSLKGIGPYTAAAIVSIAFNNSYAAVDGNITRVLARLFEIKTPVDSEKGKKEIQLAAEKLINKNDPGLHNQALMELGAIICLPASPDCLNCPVSANCLAYKNKSTKNIPVKKSRVKQRNRYFYYLLIDEGNSVYLQKRDKNDIWENLYELPLIETKHPEKPENIISKNGWEKLTSGMEFCGISDEVIHILSHQKLFTRFICLKKSSLVKLDHPLIRVNKKDIHTFAVPRLVEKYLIKKELIN
ncbi:MAG: A/G-specific adenine glycosylase [Prolixibacteraceae bacterium]|nr:A/G-specific adenine glycosylase [Prolixibacteraceae bacterium]MBN2772760.1 A/G-specific adenine glycosylase [Prolixibacteraceae bacterium]